MPNRVLITGGTGLLGRSLVEKFSEGKKWEVLATGFSRLPSEGPYKKLDLTKEDDIRALVREFNPHVIVHSAAEKRPDVCKVDPKNTQQLNVRSTEVLAELAAELPDTFLIFISTDYVFDGANPPYKPNSPKNPLNLYGQSKNEAEEAVWRILQSAGVLRIPVLYGPIESLEESSVTTLIKDLQVNSPEKQPRLVDHYSVRYPTYTRDIAQCVVLLAERRLKHCSLSGTWHFAADVPMTKYEMLIQMAELLNASHDHIQPQTTPDPNAATRPQNVQLDTTAIKMMGFLKITPFKEGMKQVLDEYKGEL